MTITRKDEARYLSAEERDLVARSHHPELDDVPSDDLSQLRRLVRERRDRARDIAQRQRREIRGKARAKGADAARDDAGSKMKLAILAQAVKRLNTEAARRERAAARASTADGMRQALERKKAATAAKRERPPTAGEGMAPKASTRRRREPDAQAAGRVSAATKRAQAKRDGG